MLVILPLTDLPKCSVLMFVIFFKKDLAVTFNVSDLLAERPLYRSTFPDSFTTHYIMCQSYKYVALT